MFGFLKRVTYKQGFLDGLQRGKGEGYQQRQKEQWETFQKTQYAEQEYFLNAPLIVILNEWDNPIIGFGERVEAFGQQGSPMLAIKDYLTMKAVYCGGVKLPYSRQRLDALLTLNPFDLCSLVYTQHGYGDFNKNKSGERWSNEKILSTLETNGFFEKANEFLKNYLKEEV
jgi:hypothetical protein